MRIRHKLAQDFQYLAPDKKIFILKSGTILEDYVYKSKGEDLPIDRDIVDNNQQFFQLLDWKAELLSHLKTVKIPQPALISKKLVPFIEDMILSSIGKSNEAETDSISISIKEIELKEKYLNELDRNLKSKEEEIDIRISRIEKREISNKDELIEISSKEDELRERIKELSEREFKLQNDIQELNEKSRNFDKDVLISSEDIDLKYKELQLKIEQDLNSINEREKELDKNSLKLSKEKEFIDNKERDIENKERGLENKRNDFQDYEIELRKLNNEISEWENTHWKFRRNIKPPSAK